MATSGTQTFKLDVSDVIEEAYERCGLELRSGYDAKTAKRSLNLLLADWASRGLNLWTVKQITQALVTGTVSYTLDTTVIDITDAVVRRSGVDYTLTRIGRSEYMGIPDKDIQSRPTQYWLDRQTTPVLYIYPAPENSTDTIVYNRSEKIEDINALTDDVDIPVRFFPPLVSGLAYYLAQKKAPDRITMLKAIYDEEMIRAETEDREKVSLRLVPGVTY